MATSALEDLGQDTYLYRPLETHSNEQEPNLVLICGWMGAKLQHVQKYVDQYARLYPTATICVYCSLYVWKWAQFGQTIPVLIQCRPDIFWSFYSTNLSSLNTASQVFQSLQKSRLLVHCFSNGGGIKLTHLARVLKTTSPKLPAIRPRLMVLDSLPGSVTFRGFFEAFALPFRHRSMLIRWPAYATIATCYGLAALYKKVTRRPDRITAMRQDLLNPSLFSEESMRTFIYSDEDTIIDSKVVEAHADQAAKMFGSDKIQLHRFVGSGHVAHMRHDPRQYWETIRQVWEKARQP